MADQERALIIGHRDEAVAPNNIGLAVDKQLGEAGLELAGVVRSSGLWTPEGEGLVQASDTSDLEEVLLELRADFVFLAIPSNRGDVAVGYMESLTGGDNDSVVITAEKGALAEHFARVKLLRDAGKVKTSASLGGGSGIQPYLEQQMSPRVDAVHGIVNGTWNFISTNTGPENNWVRAVDLAIDQGFAEPLEDEPEDPIEKVLAVANGELLGDIAKKTANLWNLGFSDMVGETIHWSELQIDALTKEDLNVLTGEHRLVVSIYKPDREIFEPDYVLDNNFRHEVGEWVISAGFIDITKLKQLDIDNENNGLVVVNSSGRNGNNRVVGEGAGPGPTSNAMLLDMEQARRERAV